MEEIGFHPMGGVRRAAYILSRLCAATYLSSGDRTARGPNASDRAGPQEHLTASLSGVPWIESPEKEVRE